MPIPFAQIDSESIGLRNLQLYFWRNAVEHFYEMAANVDEYTFDEAVFDVDASMVIVLGGTSISQLLGQQWRNGNIKTNDDKPDRVPSMIELLNRIISGVEAEQLNGICPNDTKDTFADFVRLYDALRHFGEPKEDEVAALDKDSLCRYMTTLQNIWHIVATRRPKEPVFLKEADFTHCFEFPEPTPDLGLPPA